MNTLTPSEKSKPSRRLVPAFASLLLLSTVTPAVADTLYSFSTTQTSAPANSNTYDQSNISVSVATGLTSTAATAQDITNIVTSSGLTFSNSNWAGFTVFSGTTFDNPSPYQSLAVTSSNWLTTDAFTFTITRQEGYEWDLTSLDFLGARGGTSGNRGFEIFASIDGVNDFNADLVLDETAAGANGGMSTAYTRANPHPYSIDLTDPRYANATSITFRYIPVIQTHSPAYAAEINGFTVNGTITAIPEPGTWVMLGIGFGVIVFRLRRLSSRGTLASARL